MDRVRVRVSDRYNMRIWLWREVGSWLSVKVWVRFRIWVTVRCGYR